MEALQVEQMTTTVETERFKYGILVAADVENGKVIDLDVFILARLKKKVNGADPVTRRKVIRMADREELLARRSVPEPGAKVPADMEAKYKEYNVLYPVEESRTVGLEKNKFMGKGGFG
jgi:hypothetical protein